MPRLWIEYGNFLGEQRKITRTRKCFDRALRALPITQHAMIWRQYSKWARSVRFYNKYNKFNPVI